VQLSAEAQFWGNLVVEINGGFGPGDAAGGGVHAEVVVVTAQQEALGGEAVDLKLVVVLVLREGG